MPTPMTELDLIRMPYVPSNYYKVDRLIGVVVMSGYETMMLSCGVPRKRLPGDAPAEPVYDNTGPLTIDKACGLTPGLFLNEPVTLARQEDGTYKIWGCGGRDRTERSDEVDRGELHRQTAMGKAEISTLWNYARWYVPYNEIRDVIEQSYRTARFLNHSPEYVLRMAIARAPCTLNSSGGGR